MSCDRPCECDASWSAPLRLLCATAIMCVCVSVRTTQYIHHTDNFIKLTNRCFSIVRVFFPSKNGKKHWRTTTTNKNYFQITNDFEPKWLHGKWFLLFFTFLSSPSLLLLVVFFLLRSTRICFYHSGLNVTAIDYFVYRMTLHFKCSFFSLLHTEFYWTRFIPCRCNCSWQISYM